MRTLPASYYSQSLEDAFEKGARQAAITHGHPSGYLSAGAYSAICHALLYGASWESALEHTLAVLSHYQGHEETLVACQKATMALQEELIGPDLTEYLGEGWVGEEALAVALYCAKRSHSFEQCVQWATNHSGDSDSTAMLAASLFAILHPLDTSYLRWMHHLDVFPVLEHSKAWLAPLSPSSSC